MPENFVVDNSVVMAWFFQDQADPYADTVMDRLEESSAAVPSLWPLEVVNVLLAAERRKLISPADSERFIRLLAQLPIFIDLESSASMMKDLIILGRAHKLSSYDTAYLELAMRKGLPLATLDKSLRRAAKAEKLSLV
jgi:predicted nucleic acid-binding protein